MARRGRARGRAFPLAVMPFLLAGAAPAAAAAPTPAQLAGALRAFGAGAVAAGDVRAIACTPDAQAPAEHDCHWEQRTANGWTGYSTWLALAGNGWTVIDDPLPDPVGRNRMLEEERQRAQDRRAPD